MWLSQLYTSTRTFSHCSAMYRNHLSSHINGNSTVDCWDLHCLRELGIQLSYFANSLLAVFAVIVQLLYILQLLSPHTIQWLFNVCRLLTVNWLTIQPKWLLSGAWFYALNWPKIVCRPRSARTHWGGLQRSSRPPSWIVGSDRGRERERGKEGYPREWKSWLRPCCCHWQCVRSLRWWQIMFS